MLSRECAPWISGFLARIKRIIRMARLQDYHLVQLEYRAALDEWKRLLILLQEEALPEETAGMLEAVDRVCEAIEAQDMVLMADYLEALVIPDVRTVLARSLPVWQEELEAECRKHPAPGYRLEYTAEGCLTVRTDQGGAGYYLHSNVDPVEEARIAVEKVYRPEAERWIVWGCGLGYHVRELYRLTQGSAELFVYEPDEVLTELCLRTGLLEGIPADVLHLVYDPGAEFFLKEDVVSEPGIFMHFPSVRSLKGEAARALAKYHTRYNGFVFQQDLLLQNFRCNRRNCTSLASSLRPLFDGREVVLVAGGPSLDHRLGWLAEHRQGRTVLAVGTVWDKLLRAGVAPDCVVVLDAQERTFQQLPRDPGDKTPLILASSANWRFGKHYRGPKFLALQRNFDRAVSLAAELGEELFDADAETVTSFALDIAVRLGAVSIRLLGADFAYPEGQSHAEGTADRRAVVSEALGRTRSVAGGTVATDTVLTMFRTAVEEQIRRAPQVRFINMSDCGAYIEGAESDE